jgi:hypothetical protein
LLRTNRGSIALRLILLSGGLSLIAGGRTFVRMTR